MPPNNPDAVDEVREGKAARTSHADLGVNTECLPLSLLLVILGERNFLAVISPPTPQEAPAPLPTESEENQAVKIREDTNSTSGFST